MDVDLFAGLPVSDLDRAKEWYPRLLGDPESFDPNDTERVWTLAEHRYVYAVLDAERAGRAIVTLFVDDLDGFARAASSLGIEPIQRETYDNGVRKIIYRDPDGNEIGFGGAPVDDATAT